MGWDFSEEVCEASNDCRLLSSKKDTKLTIRFRDPQSVIILTLVGLFFCFIFVKLFCFCVSNRMFGKAVYSANSLHCLTAVWIYFKKKDI